MNRQLAVWHAYVKTQEADLLGVLLAEDVKFHSPFVWKPKEGKIITIAILTAVAEVFTEFRYVSEILSETNWSLQFEAKVGELSLRGVDLIELNGEGKITNFEVMIRPANALQAVGMAMSQKLAEKGLG